MIAFCVVSAEFQIPNPRADEDADVTWALTTACKLQQCGEEVDAVRWVRRAASTAADAGDDERALELFRVAVELANSVSERSDDEDTLQQLRRVVATPLGRSGVPRCSSGRTRSWRARSKCGWRSAEGRWGRGTRRG